VSQKRQAVHVAVLALIVVYALQWAP
jgi:hypothetical protein